MSVSCHQCQELFKDYMELAVHIMSNKKTHKNRKGRVWAANYVSSHSLSYKAQHELSQRTPLTDEQKVTMAENKEKARRELSGATMMVKTICPIKRCGLKSYEPLPVEFTKSPSAWKVGDRFVKVCSGCQK
jgi:hypothetical protein